MRNVEGKSIFDIFYSKRIEKIYMTHTSWRILKRDGMCNERKKIGNQ